MRKINIQIAVLLVFLSAGARVFAGALPSPDYKIYEKNAPLEMVIQSGHFDSVKKLLFSPDGKYIFSSSNDNTIRIWNREGILIKIIPAHAEPVQGLALSPDGKYLVSGSTDKTVKIWTFDGRPIKVLEGHDGFVSSVAVSPDSTKIISSSYDKTARIWSSDGQLLKTIKEGDSVLRLAPAPDGTSFAAGCYNGAIRLWSYEGEELKTFQRKGSLIAAMAFSPDGSRLACGDLKGEIKIWDRDGKLIKSFAGHSQIVTDLAFGPDGKYFVTVSFDRTLKIWDSEGNNLATIPTNTEENECAAVSPDGMILASGSQDHTIKLWSKDGAYLKTLGGNAEFVKDVKFSPDGQYFATASGDNTIKLWRLDGSLVRILSGHQSAVWGLAFSPDGKLLASCSFDRTVRLWNNQDGKLLWTLPAHSMAIDSIAFSPDGKHILTAGTDQKIKIWNLEGQLERTLEGHTSIVECAVYSPDGNLIVSASDDKTVRIWSPDGKLLKTLSGPHAFFGIAFSPDGKTFASSSFYGASSRDNSIKLWNTNGELLKTISTGADLVGRLCFSRDGKYLLGSTREGPIRLWELDGKLIRSYSGHTDWVYNAEFSPDGKYIVSGSRDASARIWNAESAKSAVLVTSGNEWIFFTPEGYFDCSRGGGELVKMVRGVTCYSVDQFAVKNNRPDLILKTIGCGDLALMEHYRNQYLKRLRKSGFTEEELSGDFHVPNAEITGAKADGKNIELSFSLKDDQYNLKRYNIYINDVPLFGAYGRQISGRDQNLSEILELTAGRNKIEVSCINEKGAESYRALTFADCPEAAKGDLYYLGFGISKYQDQTLNLKYADKDAQDLAALFSRMKGPFNNVYTKTYCNEQVTVKNIKLAKEFLKNARPDDTFVLFIAGHGVHDLDKEATYYYLTYNTSIDKLSATAANFELIENLLQGVAPRNKLFLMDTCESGEAEDGTEKMFLAAAGSRGLKARAARDVRIKLKGEGTSSADKSVSRSFREEKERFIYNDLLRRSGAIVFSSCRGGESSFENDTIENGLFTEDLINALTVNRNQADKDGDGLLSTDELRSFVRDAVSRDSQDLQHPTVDRDNICQKFGFPAIQPAVEAIRRNRRN